MDSSMGRNSQGHREIPAGWGQNVSGATGQLRSEMWGEGNQTVSAIGLSMDGDAEGDLEGEFRLISSVGGHRW